MSTTTLNITEGAAGNGLASGSLAAGATVYFTVDLRGKLGGRLFIKNTPGGTVAATRGLTVSRFTNATSTTPDYPTIANTSFQLPSAVATIAESRTIELGPGLHRIGLTNNDASNAVTVMGTYSTYDSYTTA